MVTTTGTEPVRLDPMHRDLLAQILDKWSLSVMENLCERPHRFGELRRAIPDVSQKSLTSTLRRLERNGVIERDVKSIRPFVVEYRISPLGKTFREPVDTIIAWAEAHISEVQRAQDRFDEESEQHTS